MVTVYMQKFCPKCEELKDLLKRDNIDYVEVDVNDNHRAYAKMVMNNIEETPVVTIKDRFITRRNTRYI